MSKSKPTANFNANACCQPIFNAIHLAIKDLSQEQAMDVLEELSATVEGQLEAIEGEIEDANS